jgi:hypothetical protein
MPSFMALSCSGECLYQSVISPMTRSGSRERYDFFGLPGNFMSVAAIGLSLARDCLLVGLLGRRYS